MRHHPIVPCPYNGAFTPIMPANSQSTHRVPHTAVSVERIHASYNQQPVLRGVSLQAGAGDLVALLGPSGCGKTTLLKVVAGLLPPDAGEIRFNGASVTHLAPERRQAPMVFQQPLLFPHLTVAQNIAFSLDLLRTPAAERDTRVRDVLHLLKLEGLEARLPRELSGGQEQRVSLARAIVSSPRLLLLDEPFSALDESLRAELRLLTMEVQQRLGITTLFVTHDQQEASIVASQIILLLEGCVAQAGRPRDFYTRPASLAVARFFGWQCLRTENGTWLIFRPDAARVLPANDTSAPTGWWKINATLQYGIDVGSHFLARLRTERGDEVEVQTSERGPASGSAAILALNPASTLELQESH